MNSVLVTGGAGYIGSHAVKYLRANHCQVVVLDNLSRGFADAVPTDMLVHGSIGDALLLDQLFEEYSIDTVMNFAAFAEIDESLTHPGRYYRNNVGGTIVLLDAMVRHGVQKHVFSSSAAIFGNPEYCPIDERHPQMPINPYGRSKWIVEQLLQDYATAYGLNSVCLRYFNAAGADPEGELGERHEPETHLIPLILQAASGRRSHISIFGTDYGTPDGTCVRDYIHVMDLAQAHWLALKYLEVNSQNAVFNLGNGSGYSIRDVIDSVKRITGSSFRIEPGSRRKGDPAVLVADSHLAEDVLDWRPQYGELDEIIKHAWAWEQSKGERW